MILLVGAVFLASQVQVLMCISRFLQYNRKEPQLIPRTVRSLKLSAPQYLFSAGPSRIESCTWSTQDLLEDLGHILCRHLECVSLLKPQPLPQSQTLLSVSCTHWDQYSQLGSISLCNTLKNVPRETCRFSVGPISNTSLLKITA